MLDGFPADIALTVTGSPEAFITHTDAEPHSLRVRFSWLEQIEESEPATVLRLF